MVTIKRRTSSVLLSVFLIVSLCIGFFAVLPIKAYATENISANDAAPSGTVVTYDVDTTPPYLVSGFPCDSGFSFTSGIATSGNIFFTFSEPMDTTAMGTFTISNSSDDTKELSADSWIDETTCLIPYNGLAVGTAHVGTIRGFKDIAGNAISVNSWNLRTEDALSVLSFEGIPAGGTMYVGDQVVLTPKGVVNTNTGSTGWVYNDTSFDGDFTGSATFTALNAGPTTITYTASKGHTASVDITILDIPVATAPTITTASLPGGVVGTAYNQTLEATGDAPIAWSVEQGSALPDGLGLNAITGEISGTPTNAAVGTSSFTVKATNSAGTNSKQLSIAILADVPAVPDVPAVSNITAPPVVDIGNALTLVVPTVDGNGSVLTDYGWQISEDGRTGWTVFNAITPITIDHGGQYLRYFATNRGGTGFSPNIVQITLSHNPEKLDTTVSINTATNLVAVFPGEYINLHKVLLDGEELVITTLDGSHANLSKESNSAVIGAVASGSVIVTLYKEFLQTLPNGVKTLEVQFNDGGAITAGSLSFLISHAATPPPEPAPAPAPAPPAPSSTTSSNPKTADEAPLGLFIAMIAVAGAALVIRRRLIRN